MTESTNLAEEFFNLGDEFAEMSQLAAEKGRTQEASLLNASGTLLDLWQVDADVRKIVLVKELMTIAKEIFIEKNEAQDD